MGREVDNSAEILSLIASGMGSTLHWFPEDVPLSSLASTLVGMANNEGGTVILGVSPRAGELVGVIDLESARERIFQAAIQADPTLVLPIPRQVKVIKAGALNPIDLVVVSVPAGLPHVYSLDGRYLVREGTQTNPLSARQLYKLLHQRGIVQFESRLVPNADVTDLASDQVMSYAQAAGNTPAQDLDKAYEFLVRRGCLIRAGR